MYYFIRTCNFLHIVKCKRKKNIPYKTNFFDFINIDYNSLENARKFINKYSIITISELADTNIYTYYDENENEYVEYKEAKTTLTLTSLENIFLH